MLVVKCDLECIAVVFATQEDLDPGMMDLSLGGIVEEAR